MEDALIEIAKYGGVFLGTLLATYGALVRPIHTKLREQISPSEIEGIRRELASLRERFDSMKDRTLRLETTVESTKGSQRKAWESIGKLNDQTNRTVTDEEFSTYTQNMQQNVQQLTEKLGRVLGTIEAWTRAQGRG